MRTTVAFDPDVSRVIDALRRDRGLGVSEAVNELIRRGMQISGERPQFHQRSARLGVYIDVSNVAEALELLDAG